MRIRGQPQHPQDELLTWGGNTYKDGVLGTYRSATASTSTYYVRENRGHILESTSSGTRYFYVTDYQGSVLQTVDINGTLANTYSYDPYGKATKTGTVADNWTYISGWQDPGTNLYHLGARYYDPLVGRFTQQDAVQQVNRYTYASGDPASEEDPSGRCGLGWWGNFGSCFTSAWSATSDWVSSHYIAILGGIRNCAVGAVAGAGVTRVVSWLPVVGQISLAAGAAVGCAVNEGAALLTGNSIL